MRRTSLLCLSIILSSALPLPALARSIKDIPGAKQISRRTLLQKTYERYAAIGARRAVRITPFTLGKTMSLPWYGISVQYPSTWTADTNAVEEGNVVLAGMILGPAGTNGARPNLNVVVEDLSTAPLTLNQYTEEALQKERAFFSEMTITSRDRTTVAGFAADRVRFDAVFAGVPLRYEQVWFLRGPQVIVWTFTDQPGTFESNVAVFRGVLETLTVSGH